MADESLEQTMRVETVGGSMKPECEIMISGEESATVGRRGRMSAPQPPLSFVIVSSTLAVNRVSVWVIAVAIAKTFAQDDGEGPARGGWRPGAGIGR